MTTARVQESRWPLAAFSEVMERVDRRFVLQDDREYACVGVRWWGMGAFVRERKSGVDIRRKQQWELRVGDVVYNKLFAWKGAFAIADATVDGCTVSDKFPTYRCIATVLDPDYLACYFQSPSLWRQAEGRSRGAAAISKLTLNPPEFWNLTIPLPPLDEQRAIADRVSDIAGEIGRAEALADTLRGAVEALVPSDVQRALQRWPVDGTLGDVLRSKPRNGWSPRCDGAAGGAAVLSLSAITHFSYRAGEHKRTSEPVRPDAHYWLHAGDLLVSRSNTPELVGHAAIYDGDPSPCIYPDLMMRVDPDPSKVLPEFVHMVMRAPATRAFIRLHAKGSSPTMKKISQKVVMNIPFPTSVPLHEQAELVRRMHAVQALTDRGANLRAGQQAELQTLRMSVLNAAFRGNL